MSSPHAVYKQEPLSPLINEDAWLLEDACLYWTEFDDLHDDKYKIEEEFTSCGFKSEVATKLLDGVEQLESLDDWIKDGKC